MTMNELRVAGLCGALAALALGACSKPASNGAVATNAAPVPAAAAPAAPALATGDAADVKAFLDGLYTHYKTKMSDNDPWEPMGKSDAVVFDADMVRLLAADDKMNKGELGAIDHDYICGCQDYEPFTAAVTVTSATPTTAKATADFKGTQADPPSHIAFDLVKENGAWRIHDVTDPGGDGLRAALVEEMKNPPKPDSGAD